MYSGFQAKYQGEPVAFGVKITSFRQVARPETASPGGEAASLQRCRTGQMEYHPATQKRRKMPISRYTGLRSAPPVNSLLACGIQ